MPEIPLKYIVSFSSEDRNNPSENLLKPEGTHKWRTASPGEKQATVVIQLEKASQIHSIDIGNEGSAFVEILVGKSTSSSDTDYQVLMVSSSFMSPTDSRNGTNRNAVRIFGSDKLSKPAAAEKWDRVKIVCTQPFNKTSTYGLSFIKLHSPPEGLKTTKEGAKTLGAFLIKQEEEEEEIKTGVFFANRAKPSISTPVPTGSAVVRAASRLAEDIHTSPGGSKSPGISKVSPSTNSLQNAPKTNSVKGKIKHGISDDEEETKDKPPPSKTSLKRQSSSLSSVASSQSSDALYRLKKSRTEPSKSSPAKELSKLMGKVVFVLSGFQNPYRGELREKALEMGAQYKPDWGKGCTHLICAFTNTPKFNQVRGRGKIVCKEWILDCYKQKKLLPWRKYRMGNAESPGGSTDDEDNFVTTMIQLSNKPSLKTSKDDTYAGSTDSFDTDDEIQCAKEKISTVKDSKSRLTEGEDSSKAKDDDEIKTDVRSTVVTESITDPALDIYGDSTDEDKPAGQCTATMPLDDRDDEFDLGLPDLPDFFNNIHFLLYGDFELKERRLLTRYIAAYDGTVEDYMNDRVKFVVTLSTWDDNFEQALSENPKLVFVKPFWIQACHDKKQLLPHGAYVVAH